MVRYGRIKENGSLSQSLKQLEGYKPIEFEGLPNGFDQTKEYAVQAEPVDRGDHIFVGIEIHELELKDEEIEDELFWFNRFDWATKPSY